MGLYSEYIGMRMNFDEITKERKQLLKKISDLRDGRNIIVYASAVKQNADVSINEADLIPFIDTFNSLDPQKGIDIILQTLGGSAETVEKMVRNLRNIFSDIAVIIPGMAMSAGTIFTMAADEILMGEMSSLGPIDAQIPLNGQYLPAEAILEGVEEIKKEVVKNGGNLNPAYIPILQNISPGLLKDCQNAQEFSQTLVKQWLKQYKFSHWNKHSKTGIPVTDEEKEKKAKEIAKALCSHSKWLTHARSLGIKEISDLGLTITDYSKNKDLNDAISRYFILLTMTFDMTSIYKIFESCDSQIYKQMIPTKHDTSQNMKRVIPFAEVNYDCPVCKKVIKVQVNFQKNVPSMKGLLPFPSDNKLKCPNCGTISDIFPIRLQLEAETGKHIL